MSDVPLTKKMFFETEDAWGIPCTRFDVMKVKDVCDALRKLNDYINRRLDLLKFAGMYLNPNYEKEVYELLGVKDEINKVFGVLETQDNSKKESDKKC